MSSEEIERLRQKVAELTYCLEHMEAQLLGMTVRAFDATPLVEALTPSEREAIESVIWDYQQNEACVECADTITTLRGLLERLS